MREITDKEDKWNLFDKTFLCTKKPKISIMKILFILMVRVFQILNFDGIKLEMNLNKKILKIKSVEFYNSSRFFQFKNNHNCKNYNN